LRDIFPIYYNAQRRWEIWGAEIIILKENKNIGRRM
jgi:hypothetical protein